MQRAFQLAAQRSAALEDYRLLMQEPDDSLDLLRGATLIARHRHPLLRHEDAVDQLDDLAVQIEGRMPGAAYPLRMLQTISRHLRERGFRGNSGDYYDPGKRTKRRLLSV
jgi:regulator of sirC expression with transglutaminase-like and TPR domain